MRYWTIVTAETDGLEGRSDPMTEIAALRWACALIRQGIVRVIKIEASDGEDIDEDQIIAKCDAKKRKTRITRQ